VILSRQVDIHPEAIVEAQAAYWWYRDRNASAADAYFAELDSAVAAIVENAALHFPSFPILFGISRNRRQN
jgi:plasmid stabilization system protein ParE